MYMNVWILHNSTDVCCLRRNVIYCPSVWLQSQRSGNAVCFPRLMVIDLSPFWASSLFLSPDPCSTFFAIFTMVVYRKFLLLRFCFESVYLFWYSFLSQEIDFNKFKPVMLAALRSLILVVRRSCSYLLNWVNLICLCTCSSQPTVKKTSLDWWS